MYFTVLKAGEMKFKLSTGKRKRFKKKRKCGVENV